jgi:hypothetical protein
VAAAAAEGQMMAHDWRGGMILRGGTLFVDLIFRPRGRGSAMVHYLMKGTKEWSAERSQILHLEGNSIQDAKEQKTSRYVLCFTKRPKRSRHFPERFLKKLTFIKSYPKNRRAVQAYIRGKTGKKCPGTVSNGLNRDGRILQCPVQLSRGKTLDFCF